MMSRDPNKFKAMLSFVRVSIEGELNGRTVVQPGYLSDAVTRFGHFFNLSPDQHERLVKHLETIFGTRQEDGHLLRGDFKEWYPAEKGAIDFYYWRRLEKYWKDHSILPVDVIRSVDDVTDEILGYLGNPRDKNGWNRRRGLVMGHVQMGKTTNYSALVSKAADAGYRIIVILAGQTNSLRYQTQVRLDKTFVGKSSISDATHTKVYDVARVFVGEKDGYTIHHPYCGTSQLSDFNMASANTTGAHEGNFADPILFVTKKHPKVLERLTQWLTGLRQDEKLDGPMLLIDDEADNASINTNEKRKQATTINQNIRALLHTCKQSTYVGYTATPFANIFIDPDTTDNWRREDLFPADFIKSLDPPDNYVGARRLFPEDGDLHEVCIRTIPDDYADLLPLKHPTGWLVAALPKSLSNAVLEYILVRSIRIARGEGDSHSAMLVNVSRFNAVQAQVRELIDSLLFDMQSAIESWSMANWKKSDSMQQLKCVWDEEYEGTVEFDWDSIRPFLKDSISSIKTRLVNMKGSGIDYESAPSTGLHFIGIGGLALARGLTLEGLLISYVLRNVGASDTLLQMGRWFGYRLGFENICRIHVTPNLIGDFQEVSDSVEELRADFQRMALLGKTPFEFGLKVRQSPTGIAITAANKMRSATEITLAEDFSSRHIQAYSLYDSKEANDQNLAAVDEFLKRLIGVGTSADTTSARVWTHVPAAEILRLLTNVQLPQTEFNAFDAGGVSLIGAYIEDRAGSELKEWDVALPFVTQKPNGQSLPFPYPKEGSSPIYCRTRGSGLRDGRLVKVTSKNAVAFGADDMAYGEDRDELDHKAQEIKRNQLESGVELQSEAIRYAMSRTRPLLVVHLLNFRLASKDSIDEELKFGSEMPVVTFSLVVPGTNIPCKERRYQASQRLIQLLAERREAAETDEELTDEYE
ncbi:Z1 domain-containing protein [Deefgea rivuli]|uniref:Z1 domain-containing protein n=1 Tax=Deefgea rivuli TaxID=400948 RepID=UPI0004838588|nr:Z1 domain-containing protein [Deefgea rivuli]